MARKRQMVLVYQQEPIDYNPILKIMFEEMSEQIRKGIAPGRLYAHLEDKKPIFMPNGTQ